MAYQSLYRRYRPRRFGEVKGQDHVVKALRNAVREDRVGHAYLFSGPRGTGKTTSARILAKVLNCERPVDGEPCCECESCLAVEAGTSYDVFELDAASNNGVDAMRDLIERAALVTPGRHKVYILDEVHMLSKAAEAALLKTLEEPPEHVVFVLATTDPQKVSATIRSRTQHLEFHLLSAEELAAHVRWVAADAGLDVSDATVEAVVRQGAGSVRDTLSALDQAVAAGGVVDDEGSLDDLVDALAERETGAALAAVAAALRSGRDVRTLTEQLIAQLRDAFLSLMAPDLVQLPDKAAARVAEQGQRLGPAATVRAMEVLGDILVELRHAPDPRVMLEVALVRLTNSGADTSADALLARIERLERQVAAGGVGVGSTAEVAAAAAAHAGSRPVAEAPPPAAAPAPPATRPQVGSRARAASGGAGPARREPAPASEPAPAPRPAAEAPPAASPEPATEAPRPAPEAPASAAAEAPVRPAAGPPSGEIPSREQLTLAWADHILPRLGTKARAYFAAGRFVGTEDGRALFALPTKPHRDKCEAQRQDVEQALASYFHRPVPLRLVVEDDAGPAPRRSPAATEERPLPEEDEMVDPSELVDAPPDATPSALEQLTRAFPGAELIEEDPGA